MDSSDEREAAEARIALQHKIKSQSIKKSKKNQARLPRTAGLRTLTELTDELTKAGLDPSRIQERAERLAKIQAAQRKRKREEQEEGGDGMDIDGEDSSWEDDGMDVDGEERPLNKKVKTNSGAVVAKRMPRSDRTLVGLRDEAVRFLFFRLFSFWTYLMCHFSKPIKPRNYVISVKDLEICWLELVRVIVLLKSKWCVLSFHIVNFVH